MNKKNTKRALYSSAICMILCVAMLTGSTFAWFTDSASSGMNNIVSGVLDVELTHTNNHVTDETVEAATDLFAVEAGKTVKWEPGVVVWENLTVKNVGNLAFQYILSINFEDLNNLNGKVLSEALQVGLVPGGVTKTEREDVLAEVTSWQSLASFTEEGILLPNNSVPKNPATENVGSRTYGLVIWWQPSDQDNDWNTVSDNGVYNTSDGNPLGIELGIELHASQYTYEEDSFDDLYDVNASTTTYSVVFDSNGGTGVETQYVAKNGQAVLPAAPTKAGHTFAGWQLNGADYDFATPVTGNITLVANWTVNTYKLTFDVDGTVSTKDVPYGAEVAEPAAPTKANHNFAGWSDGTQIVVFPFTMPADDVTLTATWVKATSTLTWNDENGALIHSGVYYEGDPIVHPAAPTKDGYTHTGWIPALDTVPVDDVTFTPVYQAKTYVVNLDANGGNVSGTYTYTYGVGLDTLPTPDARVGYRFLGWYDAGDNKVESISTTSLGDVNLTAKWDYASITIGDVTYQPWLSANSLPLNGSYYLTCDVAVAPTGKTEANTIAASAVNLALNGYTITNSSTTAYTYYLGAPTNSIASLTIVDNIGAASYGTTEGGGKAVGPFAVVSGTGKNTLTLVSGTLEGTSGTGQHGGVIRVVGSGTNYTNNALNVNGGTIKGATLTGSISGGAVFVEKATMNMIAGTIYNGRSQASNAGNILMQTNATVYMSGGEIYGGYAKDRGGNVFVSTSSTFVVSGTAKIHDGQSDNTTYPTADNVHVIAGAAKFTYVEGSIYQTGSTALGICDLKNNVKL